MGGNSFIFLLMYLPENFGKMNPSVGWFQSHQPVEPGEVLLCWSDQHGSGEVWKLRATSGPWRCASLTRVYSIYIYTVYNCIFLYVSRTYYGYVGCMDMLYIDLSYLHNAFFEWYESMYLLGDSAHENPRTYAERRGETGVEDSSSFLMLLWRRFGKHRVVSKTWKSMNISYAT